MHSQEPAPRAAAAGDRARRSAPCGRGAPGTRSRCGSVRRPSATPHRRASVAAPAAGPHPAV